MSDRRIATVALVVADYDEAIRWYIDRLGFALAEDVDLGEGKRWVTLTAGGGIRLLLARADGEAQSARIGDQTGGRVFLFLETDDFARDHAAMVSKGVSFREKKTPPRAIRHRRRVRRSPRQSLGPDRAAPLNFAFHAAIVGSDVAF